MKKKISKILGIISLLFAFAFVWKYDLLNIPKSINWGYLIISFFFLFLTHFFVCLNWMNILHVYNIKISVRNAILSSGYNVFMKYIPGKVMAVMGRAQYISGKEGFSLKKTSMASLFYQLLEMLVGGIIGCIFLFQDSIPINYVFYLILFIVIISFIIITLLLSRGWAYKIGKFFNKKIFLPKMRFSSLFKILPLISITWICLAIGFFFFVKAFNTNVEVIVGFCFPFALVLGIAAVFSPSGLGIREGVIVIALQIYGLSIEESTTIAFSARLWFIVSESVIFAFTFLLDKLKLSV